MANVVVYDENAPNAFGQSTAKKKQKQQLVKFGPTPQSARSSKRKPFAAVPDSTKGAGLATPVQGKRETKMPQLETLALNLSDSNIAAREIEALRSFPCDLSDSDIGTRNVLITSLKENPRAPDQWQLFLWNERKLLEKMRLPTADLRARVMSLARKFLPKEWVAFFVVDLLETVAEKRNGYSALAKDGSRISALFLSWAELEVAENALGAALSVLENGLQAVQPESPGREKIEQRLEKIKAIPHVEESPAPQVQQTKKGRRVPALMGLGGIARAVRVKQGEQQLVKEPEEKPILAEEQETVNNQHDKAVAEGGVEAGQEKKAEKPKKHVKFVSPPPVPPGPRTGQQRSLSPVVAVPPSLFVPNNGAQESAGENAGDELELQTPMVANTRAAAMTHRSSKLTPGTRRSSGLEEGGEENKGGAHVSPRVLFRSAMKKQQGEEEAPDFPVAAAPAVPTRGNNNNPSRHHRETAASAATSAKSAAKHSSGGEEDNKRRLGEKLEVGGRRLKIVELLGSGGYSSVYRVIDRDTYEQFAMKHLNQKDIDQSFENEVKFLKRLKKMNKDPAVRNSVVQLVEFEETSMGKVVLLEAGELDLTRVLSRARMYRQGCVPIMDVTDLRFYWRQMLKCVEVVHKLGIVHCDLKPANFVLFKGRLKLVDFGIASEVSSTETHMKGSLSYMPPEWCLRVLESKPADPPQFGRDIWALGCILYELAFERTPFAKRNQEQNDLLRAIADPKHSIQPPDCGFPSLGHCISICLRYTQDTRPTAQQLITHPFLTDAGASAI